MITFTIIAHSHVSPEEICKYIFDVDRWTCFEGYGPIPGISKVTMNAPDGSAIGTEFYVENTDGSKHKETVQYFIPGECMIVEMTHFTFPLNKLATHFIERWDFGYSNSPHQLKRTFELHPKNMLATIPLWMIAGLLKKAVAKHTFQLTNPKRDAHQYGD